VHPCTNTDAVSFRGAERSAGIAAAALGMGMHAESHGPLLLRSKRMGARRLALVWLVWALAQHAQPFGCDLVSVASAYKPPSSNHLQRGLHAANGATAARVVDPTSSGNEVSVELSLTQRSDPRLFHWAALGGTHRLWESRTSGSHATLALDTVLNPCVFPDGFVGTFIRARA
jgi:hypothetical protein